ncbi:uncharacterized protein LOC126735061 [Anthonomus grandis grandis]|uniref:uncharacterized protein LOC126735061 n=1 Tax=Anthonomus grandis grandis TaxID=2921223 RepID=UPI002166A5FE|nr:uncharacterized protein LOC126735061 [Anthonomus grandis grandis]
MTNKKQRSNVGLNDSSQERSKAQVEEYNILVAQRDALTNEISRFQTFLENKCIDLDNPRDNPILKIDLSTRLTNIEPILSEFKIIQLKIEQLCLANDFEESDSQEQERTEFENLFYETVSNAKATLERVDKIINASVQPDLSSIPHLPTFQSIYPYGPRLPPIPLPKFNGSYEAWTNFKDTFLSLIDKSTQINNVEKFYYLQSTLQGEAAQIISSLAATEHSYATAWSLLQERYENKKAIIHSHIKCIFELPVIKDESHIQLRKFLDLFQTHFKSLQNLGEPVKHWCTPVIYLLNSKLDFSTRKEWETFTKDIEIPTIQDFLTFLSQRCCFLESLDFKLNIKKFPSKFEKSYERKTLITQNALRPCPNVVCPMCKDTHFIYSCKKFLELSVSSRFFEARKANLCTNCLRPGHRHGECHSTNSCRRCQARHHTLLHRESNQDPNYDSNIHSTGKPHQSQSRYMQPNLLQPKRETNSNYTSTLNSGQHMMQGNNANHQSHVTASKHAPFSPGSQQQNTINHSLMCETPNTPLSHNSGYSDLPSTSQATQNLYCASQNPNSFVLLSTASLCIYDKNHKPIICKAILDNGSQSNFISEKLFKLLNIPYQSVNMSVSGIGPDVTNLTKRVQLQIKSMVNNFSAKIPALVINKITELTPQIPIDISSIKLPADIILADSSFHTPSEVDLLIGAGLFYNILCSRQIKTGNGNPILQETQLGWVVSGPLSLLANVSYASSYKTHRQSLFCTNDLQGCLEKFWLTEETTQQVPHVLSKEELECEDHFQETTHQDLTGRLQDCLRNDTLQPALKRFYSLEQKFDKNPEIKKLYIDFIKEYISLGHMSEIQPNQSIDSKYPCYYLPHHCGEKVDSTTTRLRVVFDASCVSSTGLSLNDTLKIGPNIQNDLFSIIVKFRKHNYVLIGDIAKMYRQILLEPCQRNLQRIIWRDNPNENIRHFTLNTVTYGMASSSYLATRCLKEISDRSKNNYPHESQVLRTDCYVDDIASGTDTKEELIVLGKNLVALLKKFGFDLRKFCSNDPEVLSELSPDASNDTHFILSDEHSTKTLGISWNPRQDLFIYTSTINSNSKPVTKRTILSLISQIFDPLGLLGPMIVQIKLLLQKLWLLKVDWDDPVPTDVFRTWKNFTYHLSLVDYFRIPRQVTIKNAIFLELHGFCDSSINVFGASIYVRSIDPLGNIAVNLLCAKSRVAPLKAATLPHLELCGALVLSRLMKKALNALDCNPDKINFYTDSTIVLCWISLEPRQLKTYVCNRVSEIQQLTNINSWHHISSTENPADIISRGTNPQDLKSCSLWWHGPSFLSKPTEFWPKNTNILNFKRKPPDPGILELNPKSIILTSAHIERNSLFDKFSDYNKLVNVTAYCLRFVQNIKSPKTIRQIGHLTPTERQNALNTLVIMAQVECFCDDIRNLKVKGNVKPQSKLKSLNPFIDSQGILRVGGRLKNSLLDYQTKHPMLLPQYHPLTRLIITHEHKRNFHPGVQSTLSFVWPLHGKSAVKSILRKCVVCYKVNPKPLATLMGDLPEPRVTPSKPFLHTGVDYAGFFLMKESKLRNRRFIKAYLCVFVCLATKAVHLEVVSDLTSQGFIAMLKRFVSRRGLCKHLYSDNGTNFVGAQSELQEIFKFYDTSELQAYFKNNMINFHFNPARSPHFGGLWEGVVKSFKHHLRRILSEDNRLTYEEFYTFVVQVEAILNSRPILPLSNDPLDLESLTPGHFLIGHALNMVPDADFKETPMNRLTRYQMLQSMVQHFWRRWSEQYLHTLHERHKWRFKSESPNFLGALVLLKDDSNPPTKWTAGRITDVHPGKDGVVRVVSVRISNGNILKRSIVKVCPLPISE